MLRCVEAMRLYAAAHDGKLPSKLEEITEVPVPVDPVTGKSFAFKLGDDGVTIEPTTEWVTGLRRRYELTVKKRPQ